MPIPDFSSAEYKVLTDDDYFTVKISTDVKIKEVFSQLKQKLEVVAPHFSDVLPPDYRQHTAKLNRGENYEGRPWRALDFPAVLKPNDIFAFRTILVWGRHISFNLILKGKYYTPELATFLLDKEKNQPDSLLWTYPEIWKWEIDSPYCVPISEALPAHATSPDFLRIVCPLPLTRISEMPITGSDFVERMLTHLREFAGS